MNNNSSFSEDSKSADQYCDIQASENIEELSSTKIEEEDTSIEQKNNADESTTHISEEEGFDAAKEIFRSNEEANEDNRLTTFLKDFVKFSKKARELGLEGLLSSTTINYQERGSIHIGGNADCQNIVGDKQEISSIYHHTDRSKNVNETTDISSVEEIFDKHEKIKDRSFMIALAVLEGCNYRDVVNAGQQLEFILQPKTKEESGHDADLRTNEKKRSDCLKEIRAFLSDDDELTEYGPSLIKTVFFEDQNDSSSLLRYIWYEYDDYADALLQWLYDLGEHSNIEVQSRAAAIAGQLAKYEFRPVREKIFLPWAKANKQSVQRLTALALSIVACDENEKTVQQALNILHHWSGLKNSYRLHRTAILAYGSYIGLLSPHHALDNLRIIAQSGDGRLFSDIAQAVAELFNAGQKVSGLHLKILSTLKDWIEQYQQTALHQLSVIIFWGLMRKKIFINDANLPVLLFLSNEKEEFEKIIIFLLRNSLAIEMTRDLIIQEIHSWVNFVDKQQSFYKTFARIIFRISKTEKERQRICSYLLNWSKKSNTAIELLGLIRRYS